MRKTDADNQQIAEAFAAGHEQGLREALAIIKPNWAVDRKTFEVDGKILADEHGNTQFMAVLEIEEVARQRYAAVEALIKNKVN